MAIPLKPNNIMPRLFQASRQIELENQMNRYQYPFFHWFLPKKGRSSTPAQITENESLLITVSPL